MPQAFATLEAFADTLADADAVRGYMTDLGAGAVEVKRPNDLSTQWRVRGVFDVAKVDWTKTTPPGFQWIDNLT